MRSRCVAISLASVVALTAANAWAEQAGGAAAASGSPSWEVEASALYAVAPDSGWPHLAPGIGVAAAWQEGPTHSIRISARGFEGQTDSDICLRDEAECHARYYDVAAGLRRHRGLAIPYFYEGYFSVGREERPATPETGDDEETAVTVGVGARIGFSVPLATWLDLRAALSAQIELREDKVHGTDGRIWTALELGAAAVF